MSNEAMQVPRFFYVCQRTEFRHREDAKSPERVAQNINTNAKTRKMKSIYQNSILCLLLSLCLVACSNNDEKLTGNTALVGTLYSLNNEDYSIGDDYVGHHVDIFRFYFHSPTEGMLYYREKDSYTDTGTTRRSAASHFRYTLNGNNVMLQYITDEILSSTKLVLGNDKLTAGDLEFSKGEISYADYDWLKTLHGTTGSCSWYSDMRGGLWIVGKGAMANYSDYAETPWAKNEQTPNRVVVEEGVTEIGSYAFANPSVGEVDMPDKSLIQVGKAAFCGSTIENISLSDNITTIEADAFADCKYLKQITIPESIVSIGESAFDGTALNKSKLEFGGNLRTIGRNAFFGGEASYLTFAEGVQDISSGAFIGNYCSSSKELILPNSLTSIGETTFEGPYKKIVLGSGIQQIGDKAFISGASSGAMYVNRSTPPSVGDNIIVERTNWNSAESRWTLYVPKGCKSAYSNKSPWNKFKSIVEDSSLEGGNGNDDDNGDDGGSSQIKVDYKNLSYIADGKTYKMILVDGGTLPPFYMMQTEVPILGYLQIGDTYIGTIDFDADECITVSELRKFITKLNETTGLEFRLPTEAEWKFAAKGGAKSKNYAYSGSDDIDDVAWYKGNCSGPHDIATKQPNELGLYDMSGNYSEVCSEKPIDTDGRTYGGCWKYTASDCTPTSWKSGNKSSSYIPGKTIRELNAFDGRYITVRLVYSIPE